MSYYPYEDLVSSRSSINVNETHVRIRAGLPQGVSGLREVRWRARPFRELSQGLLHGTEDAALLKVKESLAIHLINYFLIPTSPKEPWRWKNCQKDQHS